MDSIPSQIATFHAIPCVSWRIKHTRKKDSGEDWQQRMIKMLPSVAWIVGSRNTVHQSSFVHTKKAPIFSGLFLFGFAQKFQNIQKGKGE